MAPKKKWALGCIIPLVIFILFIISAVFLESVITGKGSFDGFSFGDKIAIIKIDGVIMEESAQKINRQLKKYKEDDSVKAILLRVNSPGGGIAASQEIYQEVKKAKDAGKVIVVSMGSVAASGGYYIACPADKIIANPGTVTASIGVIASFLNVEGLYDKIGLDQQVIKSGKFKDTGSSTRKMTKEERKLMQNLIMDMYDQFVEVIVSERGIPREEILEIADGRIMSGRQALRAGLIDTLGNYEDAIRITADMIGMEEPNTVIEKEKKKRFTILDLLLGESVIPDLENLARPRFMLEYRMVGL